jgi:nuclear pore complex protein Nup93
MSLFGGTNAGTTPSLFSAGTPLKRSQTLPLATDSAPEKKPFSLFPSSTPATTTSAAGSLFSTAATSQPAQSSGGLLGGLGASTSQPQQSGGLFSRIGTTAQAQPATTAPSGLLGSGTGLLGVPKPLQSNIGLGGSLFSSTQPTAQPAATGSLFGGLASQPTQPSVAQSQMAQSAPNQSAYFDQMLERGKKRNVLENGGFGDLPSLQLGLADIARKARNLGTGGPTAAEARAGDPRA